MKLNNLIIEMKNVFGVEINNEEKVKEEIINFCLLKMELFKTEKNGSELIFQVLNYINKYFVFNQKNELTEIKDNFLEEYKNELFTSLNPENFKTMTTYGRTEFCYMIEDVLRIIHYFSFKDNQNIKELIQYNWLENFKINKKSTKKQIENVKRIINIFQDKTFNLKNFKIMDEIYFCNNECRDYFLRKRNTMKVNNIKKEEKAIINYFKNQEINFKELLDFLKTNGFSEENIKEIKNILIELYNN